MRTAMKAVVRKKIALTVFAAAFVFAACAEEAQIEIDIPNLSSTASVAVVSSASGGSGNSEGEDASGSGESGGASAAGGKESAGGNASGAHSEGTVSENGGLSASDGSGNSESADASGSGESGGNVSNAHSEGTASENGGSEESHMSGNSEGANESIDSNASSLSGGASSQGTASENGGLSASSASSVSSVVSSASSSSASSALPLPGENEYIVVYSGNGATAGNMALQTHTIGSVQSLTTVGYVRTGYTFDGWNAEANGEGESYTNGELVFNMRETSGYVYLYAQWIAISYTVAYNGNGAAGGSMTSSTHTYNAAQTLTANAYTPPAGLVFDGWNTAANGSGTAYAGDASVLNLRSSPGTVTLYAQWIGQYDVTYTVLYDKNAADALGSMEPSAHAYGVSKTLTANGYTREGYTFAGWNTAANGGGANYAGGASVLNLRSSSGSVTLYARWNPNTYTVTFNANGGSGTVTTTVTWPATTVDGWAAPAREGYELTGWNTAANGSGTVFTYAYVFDTAASSGTLTVYAQWSGITYTVIYTKGAGDVAGTMEPSTHIYGTDKNLTANGFTREGFVFIGWDMVDGFGASSSDGGASSSDGGIVFDTGAQYSDGQSVLNLRSTPGSVTLAAKWGGTYTVVYDKNADDASGTMAPSTHISGVSKALTANGFTRAGYVVVGWNTAANGSGANYVSGASVLNLRSTPGSVTLYAQWRAGMESTLPGSAGTLTMVSIPAGTFTMGESGVATPVHSVTLSKGFYMGQYEVTREQYQAVMSGNANGLSASPSYFTGSPASGEVQAKRPVEQVSWYDALVFCNRLSILEGRTPVYTINNSTNPADWGTGNNTAWSAVEANWNANGYRLPTEAEWEYACRAGTTTAYSFGSSINDSYAWYSGSMTHEVGKKLPNAWGLYDMHGNVWEWCWDWRGDYASSAVTDPKGPAAGTNRVLRGGSWGDGATDLRSACRNNVTPGGRGLDIGFRLVRSAT